MITHHAELHHAVKITSNGDSWLEGHIYNDTHTHGNHPFRDGASIYTTSILSEHEDAAGDKFFTTGNTIYKVVGSLREVSYD